MSKTIVKPTLSLGNHIYLYRLLRDAILMRQANVYDAGRGGARHRRHGRL